jgi:flagellar biosynthesis protein FlhF
MKIKKIIGRNFKEALEMVKKELGADAVILSSRTLKSGPFGIMNKDAVEVTAAIDENDDSLFREESVAGSESGERVSLSEEMLREIRSLREEINALKETLRPVVPTLRISGNRKRLYGMLLRRGVDPQFAMSLVEKAGDTAGSLISAISEDLKVSGQTVYDENGYMFFGPPGIGKTTTMSKVAYLLSRRGRKVCLVTLDSKRIGSIAYMKELSRQLRCDLKFASGVSELPGIIYKESQKGPALLVDTPGNNYEDIMKSTCEVFPKSFPLNKCFLMDASMDMPSAIRHWEQTVPYSMDTIGFTKLDMATQFGNIYNMSLLADRPCAFLADGPSVPDDIRVPTEEYVAGLVAGGVCEN